MLESGPLGRCIFPFANRGFTRWHPVMSSGNNDDVGAVMSDGTNREGDVWRRIETALARRNEMFALGHVVWTADGYTVKFREGIVDIVRTAVAEEVFEEQARLDKLLDGIRSDFRIFR